MQDSGTGAGMASMARETFEHGVVPWSGRAYAEWVRAWSAAHQPSGAVVAFEIMAEWMTPTPATADDTPAVKVRRSSRGSTDNRWRRRRATVFAPRAAAADGRTGAT